ncbi:MAG: glucan 1,4-alpha-glucosidase [Conexivisphaerales archaeon]
MPGIAPGAPGIEPRWTSSAKSGVGTAASRHSKVWFTLSHGIINEVYYPRHDQANTRDLQFLVADGVSFFSEERRHTISKIAPLAQGVPGYVLTNRCKQGKYTVKKIVITDPYRHVLLQRVWFTPYDKQLSLFVLLAPHIANRGYGNDAWVGDYKGIPMLFAQREGTALALACSTGFVQRSCGYVGRSDGWQDIAMNKRMTWFYDYAPNGNVALTGEIPLQEKSDGFVLALAFGRNHAEAGQQARASLLVDFDTLKRDYIQQWKIYQRRLLNLGHKDSSGFNMYRVSTAMLTTHESKDFPGGIIASLSIPWGFSKGDEDLGGYHLVWPRDLVEAAGAMLAAGDSDGARRALFYLMNTQEPDGHWPQNMWIDGTPYWYGVQLDETAFPVLLADALKRENKLKKINAWPMVKAAASFIVQNGPVTQQDRWEEDSGYSPFTLAVCVAALLSASDFAEESGQVKTAEYLRETADYWNSSIEKWTYATGTDLAKKLGVDGYYVRISSAEYPGTASHAWVPIRNRPKGQELAPTEEVISPDALALVRFGLRRADDPKILNTVKVIDALLKKSVRTGVVWHRYNLDGYGEHDDGSPFDGTGVGRGWPLLVGERAHYELALGNKERAHELLHTMEAQAGIGGLLPEQVWDQDDIPARGLRNGHATGSAMPLVWAHAEYIKLLRSLKEGKLFDTPPQTVKRYQMLKVESKIEVWKFNHKLRSINHGRELRIDLLSPATVHWSIDDWRTVRDDDTIDSGLGVHYLHIPVSDAPPGTVIRFTFFWKISQNWEGRDFEVRIS